jgi:putative flippase GtrA
LNHREHSAYQEPLTWYDATQPLPAEPRHATQKATPPLQPSYYPTGWPLIDRELGILDRLTGGRADWFQRLFSYLFIGGCAAIVNLIVLAIVYYHTLQSLNASVRYLIAFAIATEISILANFVPNDYITFRHLAGHERSWGARCLRFHVTCIGGTLLTLAISFSLLHLLRFPPVLAQGIALIIATAFNFAFHHIFTYRRLGHMPG